LMKYPHSSRGRPTTKECAPRTGQLTLK
jgi:hypothetical protein